MMWKPIVLALGLTALLPACTLVPSGGEVALYQLPGSEVPAGSPTLDLTLKIMTPEGSDAFGSRRMLVTEDGISLHGLPGARWASPVRSLLRERLVESLRRDGRIAGVVDDTTGVRSDLELHTTVRDFTGDFTGPPAAHIRLDATLTDPAKRQSVAAREFEIRVPAAGRSPAGLTAAFGEATDRLALELADWIGAERSGL